MNGLAGKPLGRRLGGGSRTLAILTITVAALIGSSSALAAIPARRPALSHLFSIPTASASLTGPNDQHLTLRMTGARDHLTRFTDRTLRQPLVVANVDFARRFTTYFASSRPHAVLTYTPPGTQIPVSIVLTVGRPRWNAHHHTWTFSATRVRTRPGNRPAAGVEQERGFDDVSDAGLDATLMVGDTDNSDNSEPCNQSVFQPDADCEDANFAGDNLTGAYFTDANLSGADLSDANLTGADLSGANLSTANLSGANLAGANLSDADLSDADLAGASLTGADLYHANLYNANLTDASLYEANLTDADLFDANVTDANMTGADLCSATLPSGASGSC